MGRRGTRRFDDVVKAAMEPILSVFIHICRVAGMVYAITPYIVILFFVIKVCRKYTRLSPCFLWDNDHLADFSNLSWLTILFAQLNVIKRRRHAHRARHGIISFEVGHQKSRFRLSVAFAKL